MIRIVNNKYLKITIALACIITVFTLMSVPVQAAKPLKNPLKGHPITCEYGYHKTPAGKTFHNGIDIGAPSGKAVKAAGSGKVIMAKEKYGGYGKTVKIQHKNGLVTMYAHLKSIKVKKNDEVSTGKTIGTVGTSGLSTGPHLHYTVYKNSNTVNPRNYTSGLPAKKK